MLNYKTIGAVDIGSNAARLLICEVYDYEGNIYYKKRSLVRVPLRLGQEVFATGRIPEKKVIEVVKSMQAYKHLLEVNKVDEYWVGATSAMRDAQNGSEVVALVENLVNLKINIIQGPLEAKLLYETHFDNFLDPLKNYLYIDVGGGSTEISYFSKGELKNSKSFNIGTLRLMEEQIDDSRWQGMKDWIQSTCDGKNQTIEAIGSGGNINKLYKLNGSRADKRISYIELDALHNKLQKYSLIERVINLGMRSDRADVIVPATYIFLKAMKWAKCKEVYVPKFGLSDGIVRAVYTKSEMLF